MKLIGRPAISLLLTITFALVVNGQVTKIGNGTLKTIDINKIVTNKAVSHTVVVNPRVKLLQLTHAFETLGLRRAEVA